MKAAELLNVLPKIKYTGIEGETEITGIAYDSRAVKPGNLFVCIKGFQTDGHKYADNAVKNGAALILAQDEIPPLSVPVVMTSDTRHALALLSAGFYGHPSKRFKLIGVTGTNGKTTTTYLIKTILELMGKKVGLIGTNQNMIGDTVLKTDRTTPESLELQMLFAEMADHNVDYVVMEVSSHSLELSRVDGLLFEVSIFTNLTQDHLDFHETMDNYFNSKKKLFSMSKYNVLNVDDPYGKLLSECVPNTVLTYGIDSSCDIKASDIRISARGVIFNITKEKERTEIRLGIPGKFSVYNALSAIGCCLSLGLKIEDIAKGLVLSKGVKGRAEAYSYSDLTVIIDYAHTPDGLENILGTVSEFSLGRIVTVFGCGGDRDRTKRPKMGKIAGELSDFCIITSDNPRTEDPMRIISEIEAGMKETGCEYLIIENRYEAIKYALTHAQKDDIVVLAGKGHETYQILKDRTIEFDERKVISEIMSNK